MMNKRHFWLFPVFLLIAFLSAQCGGNNNQQRQSQGFNPPDRSVAQPTATTTVSSVFDLATQQALLPAPILPSPTAGGTQVTTDTVMEGQVLVNDRCTMCHTTTRIERSRKSPAEWKATVDQMIAKGAVLDATEEQAVLAYLSQTFPK